MNTIKDVNVIVKWSLSETLSKVYSYFRNGIFTSSKPRKFAEERLALNLSRVDIGYNSGQFHHRPKGKEELIANAAAYGILRDPQGSSGYKVWGKFCLILPLYNEAGEIIDLYAFHPEKELAANEKYLREKQGWYPHVPTAKTQKLLLVPDMIEAAIVSGWIPEERTGEIAVCGLHDREILTEDQQEVIAHLELESMYIVSSDSDLAKGCRENLKRLSITADAHLLPLNENEVRKVLAISPKEAKLPVKGTTKNSPELENKPQPSDIFSFNTDHADYITFSQNGIIMTVLGGIRLDGLDQLKVTLRVHRKEDETRSIRHSFDLYHFDQVERFLEVATEMIDCPESDLRKSLVTLTNCLEKYRLQAKDEALKKPLQLEISDKARSEAMEWLSSPGLMEKLTADLGHIGIIGEELNRLIVFLVMTSRKLENPLHLITYGSTGVGKSALTEVLGSCMPPEDCFELTSTSDKAFFHWQEYDLEHKLILIQDLYDISDEVLYQIRELQSKRKLTRTVTIKDKNGEFKTVLKTVQGPVCVIASTTADQVYPDNANRSIEIYMDESDTQDELILERQRNIAAGRVDVVREEGIKEKLRNIERLLQPVTVRNPFAPYLHLPKTVFKRRRTNAIYLGLIEAITFLHQYSREKETDTKTNHTYIQTIPDDIRWANRLMEKLLLSKADMLSGMGRHFFETLKEWLSSQSTGGFTQREACQGLRMHPSKVKRHIRELADQGLIVVSGGDRYKKGYRYQITDAEEYEKLQTSIHNSLEQSLAFIEEKYTNTFSVG